MRQAHTNAAICRLSDFAWRALPFETIMLVFADDAVSDDTPYIPIIHLYQTVTHIKNLSFLT